MTSLLTQSRFAWALLGSAIAHLCLLFWLPSSVKFDKLSATPKRISLVKVISLPPTLKSPPTAGLEIEREIDANITAQNANSDAPEPLAPELKQSLSVLPLPNKRPLTTLNTDVNLPKIAMEQPQNEEPETNPIAKKAESNQVEKSTLLSKPTTEGNTKPTAPIKQPKQSSLVATKKAIATPIPKQPEPAEKPTTTPFTSTLAGIYQQYGAENLVPRLIAPKDALIDPDKREPGIEWIEPVTNSSQIGTVTILLIVAPDGTVAQELINDSDPTELREIALQTVKGYYQKFLPIEPKWKGKYRLVTIRFEFMNFAG